MTDTILIMGATGTIGTEVIKSLSKQQVNIKAAVHQPKNTEILREYGAEIVPLDITRPETFKTAFAGVRKLFLLPPAGNVQQALIQGIIDYAKKMSVEEIVLLSQMKAEDYPKSTHMYIEKYLQEQEILHLNVRPNFFMQNFNTYFLDHINKRKLINIYDANVPTSFIDARDVGAVVANCLVDNVRSTRTVTLTGFSPLTHAQVAEIISKASGTTIKYTAKSDEDTRTTLLDCGWDPESIEAFFPLFIGVQRGDFSPVYNDVANILGREPISFQQYAEDYKNFWK